MHTDYISTTACDDQHRDEPPPDPPRAAHAATEIGADDWEPLTSCEHMRVFAWLLGPAVVAIGAAYIVARWGDALAALIH